MKQKIKNWLVLISALVIFFSFYIVFAIKLGENVEKNVSEGITSTSSSYISDFVSSFDSKIFYIHRNLASLESDPSLASYFFVEEITPSSLNGYAINGDKLLIGDGERMATVTIPSFFAINSPLVKGFAITLPDSSSFSTTEDEFDGSCLEYTLDESGIKVAYHIMSSSNDESGSRGKALVIRSIVIVAVLFLAFIIVMALYTLSREPFNRNKNKAILDRILKAVTGDFVFLVEVDLDKGKEQMYFFSQDPFPYLIDGHGDDYRKNIVLYANSMVVPEDRDRFLELMDLDNLRRYFSENSKEFTIEFDVVIEGEKKRYQGAIIKCDDECSNKVYIRVRDITNEEREKSENNRRLMAALAEAEEANKGKSYFLFNMSHDIRTPLNAVIGYSELAKNYLDDKEVLSRYIDKIHVCGKQLLGLIGDVLDMAKIESGRSDIIEKPCLCQDLVGEVMASVKQASEEKGLSFTATGNACHTTILCDKVKVQKILLNIISNAIKYTPKGGEVFFDVTETKNPESHISDFVFTVRDTGIGISESFLPYIFNSFSRERNATMSGVSGTGLGMTITKRLVDAMNGQIKVSSRQGEGTEVRVALSFKEVEGVENKKQAGSDISLKGKRVLIAEDNEINGEIACEILREEDILVELVTDGMKCLEAIKSHDAGYYDLVLMDIQMPIMDGYEATRQIRRLEDKKKRTIPVVAMTANAFEEDRDKAFRSGMNGHIAKPVEIRHLMETIRSIIK